MRTKNYLLEKNGVAIKPIIVTDQIVINRRKIINDDATTNSKFCFTNIKTKLPSVTPIPPGNNEKIPANIEV